MKLGCAWSAFRKKWLKTKMWRSGRNYIPSHTPCEPKNHGEIMAAVNRDGGRKEEVREIVTSRERDTSIFATPWVDTTSSAHAASLWLSPFPVWPGH